MAAEGSIDPDSQFDPCEYCGKALDMGPNDWFFVEVSWGWAIAHRFGSFTFCTQEHAAAYLAENNLPEPPPSADMPLDASRWPTLRGAGVAILVLLNVLIYVLGLVTWLRWVWR